MHHEALAFDDVVVIARDAEPLLYAYLDLFLTTARDQTLRNAVSFMADESLRALFQIVHAAFIQHRHGELDPFVLGQYGQTMTAWAESRRLYWFRGQGSLVPDRRRIWLVPGRHLQSTRIPGPRVGVAHIGHGQPPSDFYPGAIRLDVPSEVWSVHSSADVIQVTHPWPVASFDARTRGRSPMR